MDITCILIGLLFMLFGFLFSRGKIHIHLNAWKQMTHEEQSKIRIKLLCLNIGEVIILNGLIFFFKGIGGDFASQWFNIAIVIWMVIAAFDVWYISKNIKKYYGKQ